MVEGLTRTCSGRGNYVCKIAEDLATACAPRGNLRACRRRLADAEARARRDGLWEHTQLSVRVAQAPGDGRARQRPGEAGMLCERPDMAGEIVGREPGEARGGGRLSRALHVSRGRRANDRASSFSAIKLRTCQSPIIFRIFAHIYEAVGALAASSRSPPATRLASCQPKRPSSFSSSPAVLGPPRTILVRRPFPFLLPPV
ncbi:hypothetical protein L226DRAFT_192430 [Lentinus tigrinus ALCF2SS1-7]|uniref:Uncharacterized protein n=1 Tax=Lentinus tigrinus ALCF2SS1-6 TaxID=1328759 RepID=A0A5C2ST33_9APHY|nr:hypothetical protein L227DRAFT_137634 [Lentinus tigrinus ALCF2SS1-6]RPD80171.1 hypothetical protein L226DRAFT_192430 [Lentinus tigrinus ALCF2SS1-7]